MIVAVTGPVAFAYPEGAPWGAANPDATESCANCHYDYEPVANSPALSIEGLPANVVPGQRYSLVVRLVDDEARVSGFQILASRPQGDAGMFGSDAADIESDGEASRSTAVRTQAERFEWPLWWQAPAQGADDVVLFLAASSANDDQSPFGDRIHYRRFRLNLPSGGDKR